MATLYVTSSQPGAGKTALCCALAREFAARGKRVAYFKPFSPNPDADADVAFATQTALEAPDQPLPVPALLTPQALHLDRGTSQRVLHSFRATSQKADVTMVEGPSLNTEAGDATGLTRELAELLDARVLLVLPYSPSLTPEQVAETQSRVGGRVEGVLLNSVTRYRMLQVKTALLPALEARGVKVLGAIPEDRRLLALTVEQLVQRLNGQWLLNQDKGDRLVEHFFVGGFILEWGVRYFGRHENKAVITRADRPDQQMAALETSTSCLVMTGGHQPIPYVYTEAANREVPVVVVKTDTLQTAEELAKVVDAGSFHHPEKLLRFQELLRQHAKMDGVLALAD